jgi:hypothetical protein
MIFIGDLYQLPPVVSSSEKQIFKSHYTTPYFFSAKCFDGLDMGPVLRTRLFGTSVLKFVNIRHIL